MDSRNFNWIKYLYAFSITVPVHPTQIVEQKIKLKPNKSYAVHFDIQRKFVPNWEQADSSFRSLMAIGKEMNFIGASPIPYLMVSISKENEPSYEMSGLLIEEEGLYFGEELRFYFDNKTLDSKGGTYRIRAMVLGPEDGTGTEKKPKSLEGKIVIDQPDSFPSTFSLFPTFSSKSPGIYEGKKLGKKLEEHYQRISELTGKSENFWSSLPSFSDLEADRKNDVSRYKNTLYARLFDEQMTSLETVTPSLELAKKIGASINYLISNQNDEDKFRNFPEGFHSQFSLMPREVRISPRIKVMGSELKPGVKIKPGHWANDDQFKFVILGGRIVFTKNSNITVKHLLEALKISSQGQFAPVFHEDLETDSAHTNFYNYGVRAQDWKYDSEKVYSGLRPALATDKIHLYIVATKKESNQTIGVDNPDNFNVASIYFSMKK